MSKSFECNCAKTSARETVACLANRVKSFDPAIES